MDLKTPPVAATALLIRRPPEVVFEAFADPAVTSRFWFTKGSGRLAPGAKVRWDWEMYGVHAEVVVHEVEPGRRILMDWGDEAGGFTRVEWIFEPGGGRHLREGGQFRLSRDRRRAGGRGDGLPGRLFPGAGRGQGLAGARGQAGAHRRPPSGRGGGGMAG